MAKSEGAQTIRGKIPSTGNARSWILLLHSFFAEDDVQPRQITNFLASAASASRPSMSSASFFTNGSSSETLVLSPVGPITTSVFGRLFCLCAIF
jgi:hypothetical protein